MDVGGEAERTGRRADCVEAVHAGAGSVIFALLAAAIVERVAWSVASSAWSAGGEATSSSPMYSPRGMASHVAYGLDHGATAHLLPIGPGFAGTVYWLLGYTPLAELVLAAWSIGLPRPRQLSAAGPRPLRGWASAWGRASSRWPFSAAPTYIAQEAVDFRVWEGGLAAFLSALMLDQALAADREDAPRRHVHVVVATAPLLFFVNPLMGAATLSLALLWAGRVPLGVLARRMTMSVLLLAMFVVPWAIRNQRVLGEPVLLRSNAGLELALAHYPGVLFAVIAMMRSSRDCTRSIRFRAARPARRWWPGEESWPIPAHWATRRWRRSPRIPDGRSP